MSSLYEVTSLFALIMNKPNMFSQILGILIHGTKIDVIRISGNWAYFHYNNNDAYIKKNSLKIISNTPVKETGSVTIKYIDSGTNDEIYCSQTINDLPIDNFSYDAKNIYGYKLNTTSPQSVSLTEDEPNQTIIFYYTKILCSITINYTDEITGNSIYNSKTISNLALGTYTYGSIDVYGYNLNDNESNTVTLTEDNPNATITFKYKEILGSVIINYIDSTSNAALLNSETFSNLKLGSYSYTAKYISGYSISNSSTQIVILTAETPNIEISFKYYKLYGTVTLQYIDSDSNTNLCDKDVYSNLEFGSYSYTSKSISGYKLNNDQTKTVTINDTNLTAVITFYYIRILGNITIKYVNKDTLSELSAETILSNLELGSYTFDAINISGYSIYEDLSKTIVLTDDNPTFEINFMYSEILGSITINYLDENNNKVTDSKIDNNLKLGNYTYSAISISGYKISNNNSITITLTEDAKDKTINFIYNKLLGKITIEYLLKDSGAILHEAVVYSDLSLGSYSYVALTFDGYTSLESSQTVTLTEENIDVVVNFEYEKAKIDIPSDLNINEVPYISTYYIKPIVKPGEEVFIDYYITDYYYKEYMEKYNLKEDNWGDDSWTEEVWNNEIFTVTVRVEGQPDRLYTGLKAGDHQVSLGSFSIEGEQKFSLFCTDKYDRSSHELFNFFLIQDAVEVKEYVMTNEDLVTYNIKNTDNYEEKIYVKVDSLTDTTTGTKIEEVANTTLVPSHKYICFIGTTEEDADGNPIMQTTAARFWLNTIVKYADDYDKDAVLAESTNNRIGLQKLLDDKKAEGYNKLLLLPGKYRIDNNGTIYVPTEFTLDMNNSTLKENQFTGDKSLMISLDGTFNSHVINGNIEGDYFSHDYANSTNNSEWPMGISISGPCKYSSFENLVINDITGYGGGNGISQRSEYAYFAKLLGNIFKLGDISIVDGSDIASTIRQTTDLIDISNYVKYEYIAVNKYLGYQGMLGGSWNLIFHFYDNNKKYIKSTNTLQFRRTKIPSNSYFMKITILSDTSSSDFWIVYFKNPCHCNFSNIEFNNCRCVGLAQSAMNDMLVNNCKWTLNGQSGAFCAYDAEDGWDQMQDVTIKNCNFINNYRNDFLTCAGHNFIIDGQQDGKAYIWERTRSLIVKNCKNINLILQSGGKDSIVRHGVYRIFNNNFNSSTTAKNLVKYNISSTYISGLVYNCILSTLADRSIYRNCDINVTTNNLGYLSSINMITCSFTPISSLSDRYSLQFNGGHLNSNYFEDCKFYGQCKLLNNNGFYSGTFNNCIFNDVYINPNVLSNSDDIISFCNCIINYSNNNLIYYSPFAYTKGTFTNLNFTKCIINKTNYDIYSMLYAYAKPNGTCNFIDCTITLPENSLLFDGYPKYVSNIENFIIQLTNSSISSSVKLISNTFNSNTNIKININ